MQAEHLKKVQTMRPTVLHPATAQVKTKMRQAIQMTAQRLTAVQMMHPAARKLKMNPKAMHLKTAQTIHPAAQSLTAMQTMPLTARKPQNPVMSLATVQTMPLATARGSLTAARKPRNPAPPALPMEKPHRSPAPSQPGSRSSFTKKPSLRTTAHWQPMMPTAAPTTWKGTSM